MLKTSARTHEGYMKRTEARSSTPGTLGHASTTATVRDLVNYLVYMGEPARDEPQDASASACCSSWACCSSSRYLLKKEYWKDVK